MEEPEVEKEMKHLHKVSIFGSSWVLVFGSILMFRQQNAKITS